MAPEKPINSSPLQYIHLVFLLSALAIAVFQIINNVREVDFFGATHWVWDYGLGFVKRALVGQLTEQIFGARANTYAFIAKSSAILLFAVIAAYIVFSHQVIKRRPGILALVVGFSGLLLYPVVPSLIYDNGRFDQLNYIMLLVTCLIILRSSLAASVLAYELCCCLGILVHEGFVLQQLPVLTLILLVAARMRHGLAMRALALLAGSATVPPVLTFLAVWLWGAAPVPQSAWIEHWSQQGRFLQGQTGDGSALMVHFRTLSENIHYTLLEIGNPKIVFAVLVVCSIAYLSSFTCRYFLQRIPASIKYPVILAAFSPCVMFLIGLDYLRWTSVIAFNVVIALLCLIEMEGPLDTTAAGRTAAGPASSLDPGPLRVALASIFYIYLLFPQSTGVAGVRPLPEAFRCTFGVPAIKETWPRTPEACSWARAQASGG